MLNRPSSNYFLLFPCLHFSQVHAKLHPYFYNGENKILSDSLRWRENCQVCTHLVKMMRVEGGKVGKELRLWNWKMIEENHWLQKSEKNARKIYSSLLLLHSESIFSFTLELSRKKPTLLIQVGILQSLCWLICAFTINNEKFTLQLNQP